MKPRLQAADPIVERLRALALESPDLEEAAIHYEAVLPLLRDADLGVAPVAMTAAEAEARLGMGRPLLHGLELELDGHALRELALRLARASEQCGGESQPRKLRVRKALEDNALDVGALVQLSMPGEEDPHGPVLRGLEADAGFIRTLAGNALKPALHAWRRQLSPLADGIGWDKGYCFVCGAGATLAELQGNNLSRHIRCGQCGSDWQSRRLQCMHCGNEDHNTLGHLVTEDGNGRMRLEVCNKCNGYIKTIASFSPTPPEMLTVEDLATLHLDYIAQELGYTKPAGFVQSEPDLRTNGITVA